MATTCPTTWHPYFASHVIGRIVWWKKQINVLNMIGTNAMNIFQTFISLSRVLIIKKIYCLHTRILLLYQHISIRNVLRRESPVCFLPFHLPSSRGWTVLLYAIRYCVRIYCTGCCNIRGTFFWRERF